MTRYSLALLTFVYAVALAAGDRMAAQSFPARDQSRPRPQDDGGVIRGRVFAADSGTLLRRAQVRLVATSDRQSMITTTDADGRYEFRDLKPGQYALAASKGGFVQTQYGQRRAFVSGTPVELRPGQTLDQIDIRLAPGASIDGRA